MHSYHRTSSSQQLAHRSSSPTRGAALTIGFERAAQVVEVIHHQVYADLGVQLSAGRVDAQRLNSGAFGARYIAFDGAGQVVHAVVDQGDFG